MQNIKLVREVSDLVGTCYFEFCLGKYQGIHWQDSSVFLEDEVFGFIKPGFARIMRNFNHYSVNELDIKKRSRILSELEALVVDLESARSIEELDGKLGFLFDSTKFRFQKDFALNCRNLVHTIRELIEWIQKSVETHEYIAVLGI